MLCCINAPNGIPISKLGVDVVEKLLGFRSIELLYTGSTMRETPKKVMVVNIMNIDTFNFKLFNSLKNSNTNGKIAPKFFSPIQ